MFPTIGASSVSTAIGRRSTHLDPVELCLLATPPAFRPIHFEYAVSKGCHVFMEKSFAVDAPGVRRVLRTGEIAGQKNLKVAGGLMSRHYLPLEEVVQQIHDGKIGEVITCWAYREHGPVGFSPKEADMSELAHQIRNLLVFYVAQRQLLARLAHSQSGHLLLGEERLARVGPRTRRTTGSRPARSTV